MSPNEQSRTLLTIAQPAKAGLSDQVTPVPEPAGSTSWRVTLLAVPAPVLDTVIEKPIGSPALTEAASAVLTTLSTALLQVIASWPVAPGAPAPRSSALLS